MTENALTTAPLTRREARAIERRTGRRVTTGSIPAVNLDLAPVPRAVTAPLTVHDTAEIQRNPDLGLVSVLPTEVLDRVADVVSTDEATTFDALAGTAWSAESAPRSLSVRAARPAALVARTRRNTAAGLGIAASAAVLATAAIAVPGGLGAPADAQASDAALASLVRADDAGASEGQLDTVAADDDETSSALVAAPATALDRGGNTSVTSFEPESVDEVVEVVETDTADSTDSTGGSDDSWVAGDTGGGAEYQGGGGYDTSSIAGIAQSMMGGGSGWACTDFTAAVYAQAGISLPGGGVSAQAAGGTPTDNPQVGDLVIFYSGHVGIYAGGDMMWDNPGYYSDYVGWQNVYRSMSVIGGGYYFVTYR